MSRRSSMREVRAGAAMLVGLAALLGLMALATGGPGFLAPSQSIDVVFRDGQGLRAGSAVRISGLDAGRVLAVDLAEFDGTLRARVKLALPVELAGKLKQDVKITIQASLTGQSRINIVSSGKSTVALVPGQVVQGVETSFFDPILEQVGMGPVERNHLSHTIAEVRQTVDQVGPRTRLVLASLQEMVAGLRETTEAARPQVESSIAHVEGLTKRLDMAGPKIEQTLIRLEKLTAEADALIMENRPNLAATLVSVKDLTATAQDIAIKERPKVAKLIEGLDTTRARADRVLYQTDLLTSQAGQMLTRNKTDIERTVANVRDATDWGDKLVQKLYANPFVLSPLYKPTTEDVRVQVVYDTAQVFTKGAQELHDSVKTLSAMQGTAMTADQQAAFAKLYEKAWGLTNQLNQTTQNLAEGLKTMPRMRK
ncbi:MlaD family protein [Isosphaeraceae bacterium EP7]